MSRQGAENQISALVDERNSLFARLGMLLYDETRDDEALYLRHPDLYLAIAELSSRIEDLEARDHTA